jgi:hypothetical protein
LFEYELYFWTKLLFVGYGFKEYFDALSRLTCKKEDKIQIRERVMSVESLSVLGAFSVLISNESREPLSWNFLLFK